MTKGRALRNLLQKDGILLVPAIYDGLSAKIAHHLGFQALFISGAGVSASILGQPDVGLVTMAEQLTQTKNIVQAVDIPVLVDVDTGYGNPINVMRTIREFEQAGVAGVQIEDQQMPKRCGHFENVSIISENEMVQKIKTAVEARRDPDLIIVARTDARSVGGLDDALERGHAYVAAGADMLMIEAPRSVAELEIIGKSFDVPVQINRTGKKTPFLPLDELEKLGFKMAVSTDAQKAAAKAMMDVLSILKRDGDAMSSKDKLMGFDEFYKILGLNSFYELEARLVTD